jgi:hypothetical protein
MVLSGIGWVIRSGAARCCPPTTRTQPPTTTCDSQVYGNVMLKLLPTPIVIFAYRFFPLKSHLNQGGFEMLSDHVTGCQIVD